MGRLEDILRSHAHAWVTDCTNPMMIYLGLLALFVLGALLIRNTSVLVDVGGTEYERRRMRRFIGAVFMFSAALCAGVTLLSQSNTLAINPTPVSSSADRSGIALVTPPASPPAQPSSSEPASYSHPVGASPGQPEIASATPSPRSPSQLSGNVPVSYSPPVGASTGQPQADPVTLLLREALQLLEQKQLDAALDKVNAALQTAPQNPAAYGLRGNIFALKKLWDQAAKDYQTVLQLDGKNIQVKFNLAELEFMQKKYDDARPGFIALGQNPDMGDLAAYKVFLCDLLGAHEEAAAKELDAFNQAGANASYYFANAAWSLYHHKTEEGRGWLLSAAKIYEPNKFRIYATTLMDLGYMPLPPQPQQ